MRLYVSCHLVYVLEISLLGHYSLSLFILHTVDVSFESSRIWVMKFRTARLHVQPANYVGRPRRGSACGTR